MRYHTGLCFVIMALLCCLGGSCFGDVYQDMTILFDKAEAGYREREQALAHSMGKARLFVNRKMNTGEEEINRAKELVENLRVLGIDPEKVRGGGGNEVAVEWYKNGDKYRYDMDIARLKGHPDLYPRSNMRNAADAYTHIYYNTFDNTAYINTVKGPGETNISQIQKFDLDYVYKEVGHDFAFNGWKAWLEKRKTDKDETAKKSEKEPFEERFDFKITEEGDLICLQVIKNIDYGEGYTRIITNKKYFSIEKKYATVAMVNSDKDLKDNVQTREWYSDYSVTYEKEASTGLWLAKEMKRHTEDGIDVVDVRVVFDEVHLGVDVPDEMFTFAGMGVPEGATICDLRESGPPKEYRNNLGVYVGLNGIDLSAGVIDPAPSVSVLQPAPPSPNPDSCKPSHNDNIP